VWAPWERCVRAVNTLQQLLARRKDAMGKSCERWRDAVGTLCTLYNWQFDILGVFRGDPTARWQVFRRLYKRCYFQCMVIKLTDNKYAGYSLYQLCDMNTQMHCNKLLFGYTIVVATLPNCQNKTDEHKQRYYSVDFRNVNLYVFSSIGWAVCNDHFRIRNIMPNMNKIKTNCCSWII